MQNAEDAPRPRLSGVHPRVTKSLLHRVLRQASCGKRGGIFKVRRFSCVSAFTNFDVVGDGRRLTSTVAALPTLLTKFLYKATCDFVWPIPPSWRPSALREVQTSSGQPSMQQTPLFASCRPARDQQRSKSELPRRAHKVEAWETDKRPRPDCHAMFVGHLCARAAYASHVAKTGLIPHERTGSVRRFFLRACPSSKRMSRRSWTTGELCPSILNVFLRPFAFLIKAFDRATMVFGDL